MKTADEILESINDYLDRLPYDRKPQGLYDPIRYVLSIGGKRFSEAARSMETQGKILISPNATEEEKTAAAAYLNKHNADFIALYEELSERARQFAAAGKPE